MNRRHFLKGALVAASTPAVALAGSAPLIEVGSVSPKPTPQERLEAAVVAMQAAMVGVHGEGVRIIRNQNHIVSFLEPEKPRIVPFQGDGDYEISLSDKHRPIYNVVRFSRFDCVSAGRCFRLRPTYSSKKKDVYTCSNVILNAFLSERFVRSTAMQNTSATAAQPRNDSPADRVERLGYELSMALADYMEGKFYAAVLPAEPDGALPLAFISQRKMPNDEPFTAMRGDAFLKMTQEELAYYHLKQAARALKRVHKGQEVHVQFALAEDYKSASIAVVRAAGVSAAAMNSGEG